MSVLHVGFGAAVPPPPDHLLAEAGDSRLPCGRKVVDARVRGQDGGGLRRFLHSTVMPANAGIHDFLHGGMETRAGGGWGHAARSALALALILALAGCNGLQRLSEVGRPPALAPTEDPTRTPGWHPVTMPMPAPQPAPVGGESLWRPGSRAFFKDQRAARLGDLVTVLVSMNDQATLKNASTATRNSAEAAGIPNLFGLESVLTHVPMDPSKLVSMSSSNSNIGAGQVQRSETVTLRLAGVVTQVLPNGNLVVMAHQQFRADNELRDLKVSGVIRPEDISSDNTVQSDRMAEARIAYGGRGQLTDVQAPRWGQQVMDVVLPF